MGAQSTYRSALSNVLLASCWLVFALIGTGMALSSDPNDVSAGGRVFGGILVVVSTTLILRSLRAGIVTDEEGVVVRSMFRTRLLSWPSIAEFGVGGSWSFVPWQTVTIERTDGMAVNAPEVCSLPLRHPTLVERTVESLSADLARRRPSPTTPPVTKVGFDAPIHPVEGGCANDYVYVSDPVNQLDLSGLACPQAVRKAAAYFSYSYIVRTAWRLSQDDLPGARESVLGGAAAVTSTSGNAAISNGIAREAAKQGQSRLASVARLAGRGFGKLASLPAGAGATAIELACDGLAADGGGRGAPPPGSSPPSGIEAIRHNNQN